MASKRWPGYVSPLHAVTKANSDTSIPHCALVLAIKYPSMAATDLAQKWDVRNKKPLRNTGIVENV